MKTTCGWLSRLAGLAGVIALAAATLSGQALQTPSDWRWRTDAPAALVQGAEIPAGGWRFVAMPPGWHVTMGPGGLLFQPDYTARGNFVVEAEVFLFPGAGQEEYGVFLGGRDLQATGPASYVAFVARRDGRAAVLRAGAQPVLDWTANDGVLPNATTDAVKNVLRVEVNAADVVFTANGKPITKLSRTGLALEGQFGFRIGKGLDLHASRLDITHRLAPVSK